MGLYHCDINSKLDNDIIGFYETKFGEYIIAPHIFVAHTKYLWGTKMYCILRDGVSILEGGVRD